MTKKHNPITDRVDLNVQLRFPMLSWSSISAWGYDKEIWYHQYVLGIKARPNAVMQGGIDVGERITQDPKFLLEIPRPEVFEQNFIEKFGDITLIGHLDGFSPSVPGIDEYKTTCNPNRWTQKAVDEWGQLDFYCLLVLLHHNIPPEKLRLRLFSIPMIETGDFKIIQKGKVTAFETKRTMLDIIKFGALIKRTHKEMQQFVLDKQYHKGVYLSK